MSEPTTTSIGPSLVTTLMEEAGRVGYDIHRSDLASTLADLATFHDPQGDHIALRWARVETRGNRLVLASADYQRPGLTDLPAPVDHSAAAQLIDDWLNQFGARSRQRVEAVTMHWSVPALVVSVMAATRCRPCLARLNHRR